MTLARGGDTALVDTLALRKVGFCWLCCCWKYRCMGVGLGGLIIVDVSFFEKSPLNVDRMHIRWSKPYPSPKAKMESTASFFPPLSPRFPPPPPPLTSVTSLGIQYAHNVSIRALTWQASKNSRANQCAFAVARCSSQPLISRALVAPASARVTQRSTIQFYLRYNCTL